MYVTRCILSYHLSSCSEKFRHEKHSKTQSTYLVRSPDTISLSELDGFRSRLILWKALPHSNDSQGVRNAAVDFRNCKRRWFSCDLLPSSPLTLALFLLRLPSSAYSAQETVYHPSTHYSSISERFITYTCPFGPSHPRSSK